MSAISEKGRNSFSLTNRSIRILPDTFAYRRLRTFECRKKSLLESRLVLRRLHDFGNAPDVTEYELKVHLDVARIKAGWFLMIGVPLWTASGVHFPPKALAICVLINTSLTLFSAHPNSYFAALSSRPS